jgi:hypothetical protein
VHDLISAGRDVIVLLASFAAVAGALSFAQAPRRDGSPRS